MKLFGSLTELLQVKWRKDSQEITSRPNQSTTYTGARDIQLPPGDTNHVLVSEGATQALTGKTINADLNTLSNIEDADIKAAAGINATKLADGSVDNTEFQRLNSAGTAGAGNLVTTDGSQALTSKSIDGDDNTITDLAITALKTVLADANKVLRRDAAGVPQSGNTIPNTSALVTTDASQVLTGKTVDGDDNTVQDLPITSLKTVLADANKVLRRDAAGVAQSGNTIPNTSALVTTDSTQALTNKDYDGGTASNTSRNTLAKASTATLSGLTRKEGNLFYDTTLAAPVFDNGSTLTSLVSSFNSKSVKNLAINGGCWFARSSNSTAGINDGQLLADRWVYKTTGTTAVATGSQSSTAPTVAQAGYALSNSVKVDVTTADATQSAADRVTIRHTLEGYNFAQIHQQNARIQFQVFSTKTGTFGVALHNSAVDRSYVTSLTVNAINTWEKKVIDVALDASGTWLLDSGAGLILDIVLMAGSNFQTSTLDAWQASSTAFAPTAQTNFMDNTANDFYVTGLQIIPGAFAASESFAFFPAGKTIEEELAMCQRYLNTSYNVGTNSATATTVGSDSNIVGTTSQARLNSTFPVTMRATPTVTVYSPATGASGVQRVGGSDEGVSIVNTGMRGFAAGSGGSFTDTNQVAQHYLALAEFT